MKDYVECAVCGKRLGRMNATHLSTHRMTMADYQAQFPDATIVSEARRKQHSQVMKEIHAKRNDWTTAAVRPDDGRLSENDGPSKRLGENHWSHGLLKLHGEFVPEADVKEILLELVEQDLTLAAMAEECDVDPKTITNWLKRFDLQQGIRSGSRCSWYRGGWRKERGPDWLDLREQILERDGYRCRECGMTQEEARSKGHTLSVHHIIPWRETHDNSPENLLALCQSCHMKKEWESGCWSQHGEFN